MYDPRDQDSMDDMGDIIDYQICGDDIEYAGDWEVEDNYGEDEEGQ